ncbi:MAG: VWA domain-containing protein, partial [Planctomycetota bacterium]|nr:VWA domain-containing protein [Planctomycetota bacterium]
MPFLDWAPSERGAFPAAPASTHRMVLLDMSESMAASHESGRRMDAALSLCRKILEAGAFRGRVDILSLNSPDQPLTFERFPLPDLEMEELLGILALSKKKVDFERGFRMALSEFRTSHFSRKELFILSDFSRQDLLGLDDYSGLVKALQKQEVRLFGLSYENPSADNFALLDMTPAMDLLLAGRPTLFYVRLGYYGRKATADTWLSVRTPKGKVLYEEAVNLAPGEKTLEIPLTLGGKEQTLVAQLGEDDLLLDNQIERSYRVSDKLSLVIVQDLNLAKGFKNPRKWLEFALAGNDGAGQKKSIFNLKHIRDHMKQRVVGGSEILEKTIGDSPENGTGYRTVLKTVITAQMGPALLRGMDGILLLDVDTTTDESIAAFKKYMIRGGTVLLGPGPTTEPDRFNDSFIALTPAKIGPPVTQEIDPEVYSGAVLEYMQNALFRELEAIQHG